MRGFPKHMNTKQDYLNLKDKFPEETRAALQRLLDERIQWLDVGVLAKGEAGLEDKTHKIIEVELMEGGTERHQINYMKDPNARLYKLGVTVKEAENLISSIGG